MNREKIKKESENWVGKGIISKEQAEQIISLYPKRDRSSALMSFAGLFIGLGFLTFVASNWSFVPNVFKMAILLFAMTIFYGAGFYVYHKKSVQAGTSFLVIGLLIFGAGIFLTGQMYNYLFFSALPFLLWSLAAFILYAIFKQPVLFIIAIAILTTGQLYSAGVYEQFDWRLGLLLVFGFGHYTYHYARAAFGYLFAFSFVIHAFVWTFAGGHPYYWLLFFFLLLYTFGDWLHRTPLRQPFWQVGIAGGFLIALFQVFFMTELFLWQDLERGWTFILIGLVALVISMALKMRNKDPEHFLDYTLFLPVVYLGVIDVLSLILLLVFSVGWLLIGYQQDKQEKILTGTISLLISTFAAYSHFAWDFMNKSVFFFTGGILLFMLSFFLERKRRSWRKKETGGANG